MSVASVTAASPAERSLPLAGLAVLALGSVDIGLEQSLILPALPALARHYEASLIAVSWLATGFLLATVVAIPLLGRLGDVFGRRRLLLVALGAFAVGGLICALAESIELVIAGRIVQGFGSAAGPLIFGLLRDGVPPERLTRAIGVVIGGASVGGAIGTVLSGVLLDNISPRSIFWFLFALSLALVVGAWLIVPESPSRARVPIDVLGAALLASGLATLLLAISKGNSWGWASASVLGLFTASAALLAGFTQAESIARQPLVDLALVMRKPFAGANVCGFAAGYSFFVVLIVVPQLAALPEASGYGLGYSTTKTGLLLLPMAVVAIAAALIAGRTVDRVGARSFMAVGSAVGLAAYVLASLAHDTAAEIALVTGAIGVTFGFTLTGIASVVVRGASLDKTSIAAGVNAVIRTTASAVAGAAAAAIITGAATAGPFPAEAGYTRAFVMGAIAAAGGLLASGLLPGRAAGGAPTP
jgi:EmrB/QacA subfamily drug resistance transporter